MVGGGAGRAGVQGKVLFVAHGLGFPHLKTTSCTFLRYPMPATSHSPLSPPKVRRREEGSMVVLEPVSRDFRTRRPAESRLFAGPNSPMGEGSRGVFAVLSTGCLLHRLIAQRRNDVRCSGPRVLEHAVKLIQSLYWHSWQPAPRPHWKAIHQLQLAAI